MTSIREWLSSTKVGAVMSPSVCCLSPDDRLSEAAALFLREQISGAPVVDRTGVCVGVLSASDLMASSECAAASASENAAYLSSCQHWFRLGPARELEALQKRRSCEPDEAVERFMTREVVSVTEDASVGLLAERLVDAHVHRVIVLDAAHRPKGIVSTTDLLAALLHAGRWWDEKEEPCGDSRSALS